MAKRRKASKKRKTKSKNGLNYKAAKRAFNKQKRKWENSSATSAFAMAARTRWADMTFDDYWAEKRALKGFRFNRDKAAVEHCSYTNPKTGTSYPGFSFRGGKCWNIGTKAGRLVDKAYGKSKGSMLGPLNFAGRHIEQPVPIHMTPEAALLPGTGAWNPYAGLPASERPYGF